jgi:hypothetical protein
VELVIKTDLWDVDVNMTLSSSATVGPIANCGAGKWIRCWGKFPHGPIKTSHALGHPVFALVIRTRLLSKTPM